MSAAVSIAPVLRNIVLVGPRLAGANAQTPTAYAYAWVAELQVAYQGKGRQDHSLVNSTLGMRVVLQSPEPDTGPSVASQATNSYAAPLMSPQLLQVVVGPTPGFGPCLHLNGPATSFASVTTYPLCPASSAVDKTNLGMDALLVVPEGAWPMPQSDLEISVPWLRLAQGRLSVAINVTALSGAMPSGFLGLVADPKTNGAYAFANGNVLSGQSPGVRLPHDPRFDPSGPCLVRIDLTPEGIEFVAEVANPRLSLPLPVGIQPNVPACLTMRMRLGNRRDPMVVGSVDSWALYPVDDGIAAHVDAFGDLRTALDAIQDAIGQSRTVNLGIDTRRPVPPVCWPLAWSGTGARPVYQVDGATSAADWRIELTEGLTTMLAGDAALGGELPSTADITPDRLGLQATGSVAPGGAVIAFDLRADRRRYAWAPSAADALTPPDVVVAFDPSTRLRSVSILPPLVSGARLPSVTWTLAESDLASELVDRYRRAAVQPAQADTTYAYLPVRGGWLQWPVRLATVGDGQAPDGSPARAADTARLGGELVYALDDAVPVAPTDVVSGRRIRITACDAVAVIGTLGLPAAAGPGANAALTALRVELTRCTGEASGLLWVAAASPSPAEILPTLAAGGLALQSTWLAFGRWSAAPQGTCVMRSSACSPVRGGGLGTFALTLHDATTKAPGRAVWWKTVDGLPVVPAVPLTRTSDGGNTPLSTRQLLPWELDMNQAVTLNYGPGSMLPAVAAVDRGLLHPEVWTPSPGAATDPADVWSGIPLIPVTLPGPEFMPGAATFDQSQVRMSFGVPLLDEYWSMARLPQADPADPAAVLPANPTSLDLETLRDAWLGARDKLMLTRTQAALLSPGWMPLPPVAPDAPATAMPVTGLLEGATWTTTFRLLKDVTVPLAVPAQPGTRTYPFGAYDIGGVVATGAPAGSIVAGAEALAGYSGRYTLDGVTLTPVAPVDEPALPKPTTLTVAGFAASLVYAPLGAEGAWRDSRGAITATAPHDGPLDPPATSSALILRSMGSALPNGDGWQRATLRAPLTIAVAGAGARPLKFWCRDLPLRARPVAPGVYALSFSPGDPGALGALELALGPTPDALGPACLPSGTYEWRFAADDQGDIGRYAITLGPLSLRPLRLVEMKLTPDGAGIARLRILGTLALAEVDPAVDGAPFGDDMACASGGPVVMTLDARGDGSFDLAHASWAAAALDLDAGRWQVPAADPVVVWALPNLEARFGGACATADRSTSGRLELVLDGGSDPFGRPQFKSARADIVLLGQRVPFDNGDVTLDDQALRVAFDFTAPSDGDPATASGAACRLTLARLTLVLTLKTTRAEVEGRVVLRWQDDTPGTAGTLVVASIALGAAQADVTWLNHVFDGGVLIGARRLLSIDVDHVQGLLSIDVDGASGLGGAPGGAAAPTPFQPIAGMSIAAPTGQATLRIAWSARPGGAPGTFDAVGLFGLLAFGGPAGAGGVTGFRHAVSLDAAGQALSSDIDLDLNWRADSRIEWPQAVDATLPPLPQFASVDGRSVSVTLMPDPAPLHHQVHVTVTRAKLPTGLLCPAALVRSGVMLESPWVLRARVDHRLHAGSPDVVILPWTSIDHIVVAGSRALMEAALRDHVATLLQNDARPYGFEARYRYASTTPKELPTADPSFMKAGLGLRQYALAGFPTAPVVGALLANVDQLVIDKDRGLIGLGKSPWIDGLVINGAGPVTVRNPGASTGQFLALPWLAFGTSKGADSFATLLPVMHQTGTQVSVWDVPDIDAAAGAPQNFSYAPPIALTLASDDEAELLRALDDALDSTRRGGQQPRQASRALMPVEQVELRPGAGTDPVPLAQQPLWLRSMLALRAVLTSKSANVELIFELLVVSGRSDGIACRVTLTPPKAADDAVLQTPMPYDAQLDLWVLGSDGLTRVRLGAADGAMAMQSGSLDIVPLRARLLACAHALVPQAICLVVTLRRADRGPSAWGLFDAPAWRDDPLHVTPVPLCNERAYASPHLGWPTVGSVGVAAAASLGMGDDRPFQDRGGEPVPAAAGGDVKAYGSGLSGRVASLSLPNRADAIEPAAAAFYFHAQRTAFVWPTGVTLAAPPARHLTASHARVRLPGDDDAMDALHACDVDIAASAAAAGQPRLVQPLVPPRIERTTYGSRPGVMHTEFDGVAVRAGKGTGLPGLAQVAACPGHIGPMLARQVRAPRGVAFPRLPLLPAGGAAAAPGNSAPTMLETHGRRTFVAVDDMLAGSNQPTPFRLFDGPATVLRLNTATGQRMSLHFVARSCFVAADVTPVLQIDVSSPNAGLEHQALLKALVESGLVAKVGAAASMAPCASLTVGSASAALALVEIKTQVQSIVTLVLRFASDPAAGVNTMWRQLDAADGDTPVVLTYVGTTVDASLQATAADLGQTSYTLRAADVAALMPEPIHKLAFRMPMQSRTRASLAVRVATLAFGDPAYDRLLSGPGAGVQQRTADGKVWKFAFDRAVYSLDTPLYFAFGSIVERVAADPPQPNIGQFAGAADGETVTASMQIQRLRRQVGAAPTKEFMRIAQTVTEPPGLSATPSYGLQPGQGYALTLDRLRRADDGTTFDLAPGDLLVFTLTVQKIATGAMRVTLTVVVTVARQSVVPSSPAVYSLVTSPPDPDANVGSAVVALHASRPLPQRIDLPWLVEDLALGHIRRAALFQWALPRAGASGVDWATLVKIDSAGGGQLPATVSDIASYAT